MLMPFIVTTKQRLSCTCWGTVGEDESGMCSACHAGGESVERLAVATLEEAHETAREACLLTPGSVSAIADAVRAVFALPESGGPVGPLLDGTVIEVASVGWDELAFGVGFAYYAPDEIPTSTAQAEILAAFNTRQAATA